MTGQGPFKASLSFFFTSPRWLLYLSPIGRAAVRRRRATRARKDARRRGVRTAGAARAWQRGRTAAGGRVHTRAPLWTVRRHCKRSHRKRRCRLLPLSARALSEADWHCHSRGHWPAGGPSASPLLESAAGGRGGRNEQGGGTDPCGGGNRRVRRGGGGGRGQQPSARFVSKRSAHSHTRYEPGRVVVVLIPHWPRHQLLRGWSDRRQALETASAALQG